SSSGTPPSPAGATVSRGARMAAAPRRTASAMKARPSRAAPGRAANRKPGSTRRESAASPAILMSPMAFGSGSAAGGPPKRALRRMERLGGVDRDQQLVLRLGRLLVDRRQADQRRHPLDEPGNRRRHHPAARGVAVRGGVGLGLVDHGEDDIAR